MMQELTDELTKRGHKVTVFTSQPKYNLSNEAKKKTFGELSLENGVQVIRVKTLPHHKVNYFVRGIAELSLTYLFLRKVKKFVKDKIDAVIVYIPPLPLAMLGSKIKRMYGAKYLLNVQDIFPQNAIDLGILKNRFLIKFFELMEKRVYAGADRVTGHTENNVKFLIDKKGIPAEKINTIYNWIDLTPYAGIIRTGTIRKKYGLGNKFIFLFAGVIGPSQYLDFVIQVAREFSEITDICFLLVGDGTEKKRLQKMTEDYGLKNVIFQPFVSKEEYPFLVKEADVGLVCVSSENKTSVFPGKILGYMAASVPIIAFLNKESDGHELIRKAGCGYSALSNDKEIAVELIRKIYNEREKLAEYGYNGFEYAKAHFSKAACIDKIEKLIQ
jgi:glycosyltransferase involved in cell wall biosynthesis